MTVTRKPAAVEAVLLHPEARLDVPATAERLVGLKQVIVLQEWYPEAVGRLGAAALLDDDSSRGAVAEIEIVAPTAVIRCAASWVARDHRLFRGVHHWVTVGGEEPPPR
jgi:hypothetical protein